MKEARDRQRRRRQQLALLLLLLAGIGGIGYGIDRGVSGGHSGPACATSGCIGAGADTSGAAPIIVSVLSEPTDLRLIPGTLTIAPGKQGKSLNVVKAPRGLSFKVMLRNRSKSTVTNVSVTLTVYRSTDTSGNPSTGPPSHRPSIVKTQEASAIGPNGSEAVTFSNFVVPFAQATKIKVNVTAALPGKLILKRTLSCPVIFALP
jgi:hypothetical protein